MRRMTREIAGAEVRAPFDGRAFEFHGDSATLSSDGDARFMTVRARRAQGVYRITRVVGGRYREDFVGVPVARATADAPRTEQSGDEYVLPVSYAFARRELRYKGYSVMLPERPGLTVGPVWNRTCIFCHNTVPYLSTVLGALSGPAAGPYQGSVVDRLLPDRQRARYRVTDRGAMAAAVAAELAFLGAGARSAEDPAALVSATRERFGGAHLVEVGIGCESCHLGARAHLADPRSLPSLTPRSQALSVESPSPSRADAVNRTCARCHHVLFSGYEPTWEGGSRHGRAGGSPINSGEARDMLLGSCTSQLSCTGCHDPHAPGASTALARAPDSEHNSLCTRCHARYADRDAHRAHARHDPDGPGGACMACHMPRKNLTLDNKLGRYHRIAVPNEPVKLAKDRPMECALCHGDRTVRWLADALESGWRTPIDRGALVALYGSLDAPVLEATLARGVPHEQAVAAFVVGRSRDRRLSDALALLLTAELPIVRFYARDALEAVWGRTLDVDLDAPHGEIRARAASWLSLQRGSLGASGTPPPSARGL